MSNLTISIFQNKIFFEIMKEIKLFSKFQIKYYDNLDTCIKNAEKEKFPLFDRALIDVPCSGTGTIGKNPEARWRSNIEQIKQLKKKQLAIMLNISKYIKPQGVICYSTCSLQKEENWDVIDAFLKLNQKYKIDNSENSLPKLWFKKRNIMEIFPPRDKLIGMFAVRLKNIR